MAIFDRWFTPARGRKGQQREEEETMTRSPPNDPGENWEFKFLRTSAGGFGIPAVLSRILEEEARAGWLLVEKFDNNRVRLKRPMAARNGDATLDFDPYRTWVFPRKGLRVRLLSVALFLVLFAAIISFVAFVQWLMVLAIQ
jgi:hypothetical protein